MPSGLATVTVTVADLWVMLPADTADTVGVGVVKDAVALVEKPLSYAASTL